MKQQVIIFCANCEEHKSCEKSKQCGSDGSAIEISFDCTQSTAGKTSLTLGLHPSDTIEAVNSNSSQESNADDIPEIHIEVSTGFVVRVWRYKGYLIVQDAEDNFVIYDSSGDRIGGSFNQFNAAQHDIDYLSLSRGNKPRQSM